MTGGSECLEKQNPRRLAPAGVEMFDPFRYGAPTRSTTTTPTSVWFALRLTVAVLGFWFMGRAFRYSVSFGLSRLGMA